ncbi:hypothetical protein FGO68_gene16119 [Halteria grandinella]|uniref:Uncharacterized protein n=1 Tax=Halteria grandinella TaxID=5974 RepID=A0A8J8SZ03_HALGN|nr:hypothetical protein FGO68_gene16119 [Halteria grandinella]
MFILGIIKSWTFGGFGLDKTYILIFFVALSQFLVNFVYFVGMFYPSGSRVLLHVSCLRTIGQLFTEPLFALVMSDFVTRLSILRNERQIATKLQPLNLFLGGIALLRFTSAIPELLQIGGKRSLEEATILIRVEGMTHYQLLQESHSALAYQMVEGVSVTFSLVLVTFIAIWLHNRLLWGVWLVKTGLIIAVAVFGIQYVFEHTELAVRC